MDQKDPNQKGWRNQKKLLGVVGAALVVGAGFAPPIEHLAKWPSHLMVPQGARIALPWSAYLPIRVESAGAVAVTRTHASHFLMVKGLQPGRYHVNFRLFGWIPYRSIPVAVTKPVTTVIPGGESLGVITQTKGLVVTRLQPIHQSGQWVDPAAQAGIERGDIIMAINRQPAESDQQLQQAVNRAGTSGQSLQLMVEGARAMHQRWVHPIWVPQAHRFEMGILVEDGASGVGTLTFYMPSTQQYAALGHSITDGLTRHPVRIRQGHVVGAEIVGIIAGTVHTPGQKVGVLASGFNIAGSVTHNGQFGIVGRLSHVPVWGPKHSIPLALPDQVEPGPAQIITVVKGQHPERFQIRILRTYPQWVPNTKGLLFQVTDPRLLTQAGGVVQGMSGSPIIQNGRMVGAVTHVLLSRPTLGFGCYAYWMATQSSMRQSQ
ncbi:MAG: SpoIVB peptidase [Sulfobacillus sp.]